jgi:hypothetical protein
MAATLQNFDSHLSGSAFARCSSRWESRVASRGEAVIDEEKDLQTRLEASRSRVSSRHLFLRRGSYSRNLDL